MRTPPHNDQESRRDLVYLTGFMASGKSTIGPILANTLGFDFVDIDAEIVRSTGKRIPDLFAEQGEEGFRSIERAILTAASTRHECVVSLGGGTLASAGNLELIKSTGLLIYLKSDPAQIFRRVRFKSDRPLLLSREGTSLNDDELRERIAFILASREPYYRQADITIRTDEHRVGITVDEIVKMLKHRIG
jgi:shikimate kinase